MERGCIVGLCGRRNFLLVREEVVVMMSSGVRSIRFNVLIVLYF